MNNYLNEKKILEERCSVVSFDDLSTEHFNYLFNNINSNNNVNNTLAGHIKEEYSYENWSKSFEEYLIDRAFSNNILKKHGESLNVLTKNRPYCLSGLWVNKQKKYEFNPLHDHSGVWSFIIPLQIPYNLEDEDKIYPPTSFGYYQTSRLNFICLSNLGKIEHYPVNMDQSYVGKVLMFPSSLKHLVYPFYTSDDYRITVSGNIKLSV